MRFLAMGEHAVLVELDGPDEVRALAAEVRDRHAAGWAPALLDVVPGARTVLLDGLDDVGAAIDELASWSPAPVGPDETGAVIEIACVYDGPDLEQVARSWDASLEEAIEIHTAIEHEVAFCGFAPGFAYMVGLGAERTVARRDSPRGSIPAGSVALAGEYTGIYPRASPGGWQLIGRTEAEMWNVERDPPALLTPGARVRFTAVAGSSS